MLLVALFAVAGTARAAYPGAAGVVLVVDNKSPIQSLTLNEARQLYSAERTRTASGVAVLLTLRPAGSSEKNDCLRLLLGMEEGVFKRQWLAKIYQGEVASMPLILTSDESVRRFLAKTPTAIGILRSDAPRDNLRVVLALTNEKGK
ncbi:MAG: hypothetical protein IT381_03030 [Deltaproteobacteria bacterium]|nr:hypothetical protein [Deltaproteobacteria bacterium]